MADDKKDGDPSPAGEFAEHANDAFVSMGKAIAAAGRGVETTFWGSLQAVSRILKPRSDGRERASQGRDEKSSTAGIYVVSDDQSQVVGVIVCPPGQGSVGGAETPVDGETDQGDSATAGLGPRLLEVPAEELNAFLARRARAAQPDERARAEVTEDEPGETTATAAATGGNEHVPLPTVHRSEQEGVTSDRAGPGQCTSKRDGRRTPGPRLSAPGADAGDEQVVETSDPGDGEIDPGREEVDDEGAAAEEEDPGLEEIEDLGTDVAALLRGHSPDDRAALLRLCGAIDELPYGGDEARDQAHEALSGLGLKAEPVLVEALRRGSPSVAELALDGLERIESPCLAASVADLFDSDDDSLRLAALRAAQRMEEDDDVQILLEKACSDPSGRIRRRVVSYLSWRASPWAVEAIRELCEDRDPGVRAAAFESLAVCQPERARDLLDQTPSPLTTAQRKRLRSILERDGVAPGAPPSPDPDLP